MSDFISPVYPVDSSCVYFALFLGPLCQVQTYKPSLLKNAIVVVNGFVEAREATQYAFLADFRIELTTPFRSLLIIDVMLLELKNALLDMLTQILQLSL